MLTVVPAFLDSGILSLEVLGSPMIILNSAKAITDLLEKKSAQSSNRYVIEFRVLFLPVSFDTFEGLPYDCLMMCTFMSIWV